MKESSQQKGRRKTTRSVKEGKGLLKKEDRKKETSSSDGGCEKDWGGAVEAGSFGHLW